MIWLFWAFIRATTLFLFLIHKKEWMCYHKYLPCLFLLFQKAHFLTDGHCSAVSCWLLWSCQQNCCSTLFCIVLPSCGFILWLQILLLFLANFRQSSCEEKISTLVCPISWNRNLIAKILMDLLNSVQSPHTLQTFNHHGSA